MEETSKVLMSLSDHLKNANSLSTKNFTKSFRAAFLSSFTINGLPETVRSKCGDIKIDCQIYNGPYNQYRQEMLNSESNLYKFNPDITFLINSTRTLLGDHLFFPYDKTVEERRNFIENCFSELSNLINSFTQHSNSKLIISNFSIPTYSPYGIFESKVSYGLKEMILELNSKLANLIIKNPSVYLFDFNSFIMTKGESNVFDYRQFFVGDIQVALNIMPQLADELLGFIKPLLGLTRKCIVLDLDNTLWGGIVGEDGFEGIQIGTKPPGNSFLEFQRHLLSLNKRGIILAINSKNNEEEALKVIREHPNMILREENFACIKINWNDKVSNIKEIASEINIGLDSMIFLDDDPMNREYVKTSLPDILTVDLPSDPALYSQKLMSLNDFNVFTITNEDNERGKMYFQQRQRAQFSNSTTSLEEFLKELMIKVKIKFADKFLIPRISQLTLKTNQFNLTTKRYQEEQIKEMVSNKNFIIGCAEVEDKFGNNGITSCFIIKKTNTQEWIIDTFLLSCRVMGRGIEEAIMASILSEAKKQRVKKVIANYVATKKNNPCSSFLPNFGFKNINNEWIYDLNDNIKFPKHIEIMN